MELGAGSTIGHNIVLERELGRGGAGTVWLAENRALQAKVAVKVLSLTLTSSSEALARFQQEARLAARLESPHVLRIYDFGVTDHGQPYIVMERLAGRDLREEIEARGPLPCHETGQILRQLCRALKAAHQMGLVHRDIKPANLFLLRTDGEPFLKVLDFGIARVESGASMGMTETGSIVGTPYYMSPEQFIDPRQVDLRSDLWSATVVMYGCLLGQLPFLGQTVGALSLAVHSGSFAKPTDVDPSLPRALDAFFERGLQVDPTLRYQSADELSAAFDAAAQSAPRSSTALVQGPPTAATTAPTAPPSTLPPSAASAHPPAVSDASGASLMGTPSGSSPATLATGPHMPHGPAAPAPTPASFVAEPGPPAKTGRGLWLGAVLALVGLGALATAFAIVRPDLAARDDTRSAAAREDADEDDGSKPKEDEAPKDDAAGDPTQDTSAPGDDEAPEPESSAEPGAPGGALVPVDPPPQARPTTPRMAPAPSSSPAPAPPVGPAPKPQKPKWRPRKMTCAKYDKSKSCAACCIAGDKLMPYPSCECFFDGEKWDREHGVAQ